MELMEISRKDEKNEKRGTKDLRLARVLAIYFFTRTHISGESDGHAGVINANLNRSPHVSHALFELY